MQSRFASPVCQLLRMGASAILHNNCGLCAALSAGPLHRPPIKVGNLFCLRKSGLCRFVLGYPPSAPMRQIGWVGKLHQLDVEVGCAGCPFSAASIESVLAHGTSTLVSSSYWE